MSAAASPSEAAAGGARTVLVSIDGGITWQFAAVLTFAAGDMSPKTVLVRAIDDPAAEGPLNAVLSMSAQSADPEYNHAEIRNVLAEVIDNDQAGLVIVESNGDTTVLQGAPPCRDRSTRTRSRRRWRHRWHTNVKFTLFYDSDSLIVTSTDPRFDPATRTFTFDWTNWTTPAVVTVAAAPGGHDWGFNLDDPLAEGDIFHVVTSTDPNYIAQFGTGLLFPGPGDVNGPWSGATATAGSTTTAGRIRVGASRTVGSTGTASSTAITAGIRSRTRCPSSTSTSSAPTRTSST